MTRHALAVSIAFLIVLTACASGDEDRPEAADQPSTTTLSETTAKADTVDSSSPAIELPTTYWPADPTPGQWYRLDILDVSQCGYQVLTLPNATIDDEFFYFNKDATSATLKTQSFDRSLADSNHLPGYARLTTSGSIEFSSDTVNNIVIYEPTAAAVVLELADPCE